MNNKILMIINAFPPSGESGVQRPLKFLKYLSRSGWDTFVITPRKPVLLKNRDESLVHDIPAETKIYRTFSLGISEDKLVQKRFEYSETQIPLKKIVWKVVKLVNDIIFPIDKHIGWVPFVIFRAVKLINKYKIRNLYITAFPFSAFLCGIVLKRIYKDKIFWIADYRDAWQFSPMLKQLVLPFRLDYIRWQDERFLRKADHVIFSSPYVLNLYREKYAWLFTKSDFITNGYDEDDFVDLVPQKYDKFTFVFMGKFYPKIHAAKGNPFPFFKLLQQHIKQDFQYLHIGIIHPELLKDITRENLSFYRFLGYKPHTEALGFSAGADINVLILNSDPESIGVIPGKIFELLRLKKPILAIGPANSVVQDIIETTKSGIYAFGEDFEQITRALDQMLSNAYQPAFDNTEIEKYSRKACTDKLKAIYTGSKADI